MPFYDPSKVKLSRDGKGGYRTRDGRFTISPQFSDPPGGGQKNWFLVDTQPERTYSLAIPEDGCRLHSLVMVRELIASTLMREVPDLPFEVQRFDATWGGWRAARRTIMDDQPARCSSLSLARDLVRRIKEQSTTYQYRIYNRVTGRVVT